MNAVQATRAYERWLSKRLTLLKADVRLKHMRMEQDPFFFMRASFYRWAQTWPAECDSLRTAPRVLAVGDLHVENFGTWRDGEGRLIWGINDFDEATTLPYANDLVRLCTSALMAIGESRLATPARLACESVLEGYLQSLKDQGAPVVLAEKHRWLRDLAVSRLREQRTYWDRLLNLQSMTGAVPSNVRRLLRDALPEKGLPFWIVHRQAGLGSLGRQRYTALASWRGGTIAREAKPLVASAWTWMRDADAGRLQYAQIIRRAVRVPDPFLTVRDGWVIRRLAPDCSRIELQSLAGIGDECRLLWMMGWETGNVHLGTPRQRKAILRDLARRKRGWLLKAARRMRDATMADWRRWCVG